MEGLVSLAGARTVMICNRIQHLTNHIDVSGLHRRCSKCVARRVNAAAFNQVHHPRELMARVAHDTSHFPNNRCEASHRATSEKERKMKRFHRAATAQRFLVAPRSGSNSDELLGPTPVKRECLSQFP